MEDFRLQAEGTDDTSVEYESVTDTIKRPRRPEHPPVSPSDRPELKKSKIPLALRSPVPIRREVKEGGARARVEPPEPRNDASTMDLLTESTLLSQLAEADSDGNADENMQSEAESFAKSDESDSSECRVVEITQHEIIKSNVGTTESAVLDCAPNALYERTHSPPALHLGTEPQTFVVEVRRLERMQPTLGVVTRRSGTGEDRAADRDEYLILDQETPSTEVIYSEVEDHGHIEDATQVMALTTFRFLRKLRPFLNFL